MYEDALTTKERIKDRLTITVMAFDAVLDRLILSVTARIESFCNRRFIQATYTDELHDGSDVLGGGRRTAVILKNGPVQSVTSFQYDAGVPGSPAWTDFERSTYTVDLQTGVIYVPAGLPRGVRNIRATYTGGYSGYSIGVANFWVFNIIPGGDVDGTNRTFTLPETASQVIVYPDGIREASANITFTPGTDTFTLADGRQPYSTIAADYVRASETSDSDYFLPADLVEVCEEVVSALWGRRQSEGRQSESMDQSSVTWSDKWFSDEHRAIMKNYRRGYNL